MEESQLRNLLINSCHSSSEAEAEMDDLVHNGSTLETLVRIATDLNGMQASYYLSQASVPQIRG